MNSIDAKQVSLITAAETASAEQKRNAHLAGLGTHLVTVEGSQQIAEIKAAERRKLAQARLDELFIGEVVDKTLY